MMRAFGIAVIAVIARNRRDRKNQIPAMSATPGDSGDLHSQSFAGLDLNFMYRIFELRIPGLQQREAKCTRLAG